MPVVTLSPSAVYDPLIVTLNTARTRLNDEFSTLLPVSGKLLGNNQVFSQQMANNAWRKVQEYLGDRGCARLINETIIQSLPPVASLDPASQTWLSWTGYFDGANYYPQPALPADFAHPLKVWERWSGQNAQFCDPPMEKILGGIPTEAKGNAIRRWEWRGDALYMPGSQMIEDLRVRYVCFLADFVDGATQWFQQPVPIPRISDGFSWFICAELAIAKGDLKLEGLLLERGRTSLDQTFNQDVRADQSVNIRRRSRSGRGYGREWY
jgi:hypothetical protein